ncbi:MAG: MMPL family transporter [Euryarchaeota archaeon]|nr:MMPL family transporter [Euryarchaeota archaeon]
MALDRVADAAGRLAARRPGWIVLVTLLLTAGSIAALIAVPAPPPMDALETDTEVVRAEERIREKLPPTGYAVPFLVSASADVRGGAASRAVFDEVLAREAAVRRDPEVAPFLYHYQSPLLQMQVSSVWSIADSLKAFMDNETPLTYSLGWHPATGGPGATYRGATDAEWQDALGRLIGYTLDDGMQPFKRSFAEDLERRDGVWHARSIMSQTFLHHERFFAAYARDPADATTTTPFYEDLLFHIQDRVRAETPRTTWTGVGIGIQHELEKEVAESGRLVIGSFAVIGVLLYLTLRNGRDWAVAFLSLPIVVLWMLGSARLLGIPENQFTAMLPVLILALGVDFAIHGVRRYREERAEHAPRSALRRSIGLLGPALLLAAATTATAFLSNAFSDVDALTAWGLKGGLAIVGALWVCGVFTPALRHLWDRRRIARGRMDDAPNPSVTARRLDEGTFLGRLATASARRPVFVLAIVALVTIPATVMAVQIESDFRADDFFDPDSGLMQGIRRIQEDYPDEGEPAVILVEGDVSSPQVLAALDHTLSGLRDAGYSAETGYSLPRIVRTFMSNPEVNGGGFPDRDGDHIPDTANDVRKLLDRALTHGVYVRVDLPEGPHAEVVPGVPAPEPFQPDYPDHFRALAYAKEMVRDLVHPDGAGGYDATLAYVGIPNTDDFTFVRQARDDIALHGAALWALEGTVLDSVTVTGEPYKRLAMVDAVTDSLKVSITLSVVLCFLIVLTVLRDLTQAAVTLVPVLVLVSWLYGFMVLFGYSLNLVTATIAAMAIGVGVDYSIHLTERFREERRAGRTPEAAVRRAMDSSGVALFGSAATTTLGFLVLLFAPMPLFATFGLITAAMASASFLAAATILPPLLVLVSRRRERSVPPVIAGETA